MPQLDSFAGDSLRDLPDQLLAAVAGAPMPGLADGPPAPELALAIENCPARTWKGLSPPSRLLCESGLWLLAGDLNRSHEISQQIHSAEGSWWHGIMHRREGDFGNSKYWFRQVGPHPLWERIAQLTGGTYQDPFEFVDACRQAVGGGGEAERQCESAQWIEWQTLMAHCAVTRD